MGIKSFNNLPLKLKNISDFKLLKSKLKTYLLQNAFLLSPRVSVM
jgi:hypothetical protein